MCNTYNESGARYDILIKFLLAKMGDYAIMRLAIYVCI